ncbi:hypothetical protein D3C87_1968860 [compost metagenome]
MAALTLSCVTSRTSWPSMRMEPSCTSNMRKARLTSVDLPEPERPTRPIFSPGATVRLKASMTLPSLPRQ